MYGGAIANCQGRYYGGVNNRCLYYGGGKIIDCFGKVRSSNNGSDYGLEATFIMRVVILRIIVRMMEPLYIMQEQCICRGCLHTNEGDKTNKVMLVPSQV